MDTTKMEHPQPSLEKDLYSVFTEKFGPEVKAREGNNIRLTCPSCKHKSLSCNVNSGLIYCFHCQYGKGLKFKGVPTGIPESKVDFQKHLAVTAKLLEICPLFPDHKQYLIKRGIYRPELYNIKSAPFRVEKLLLDYFSEEDLIESGYFYQGLEGCKPSRALEPRRILIPFWEGDKIVGIKSRVRPNCNDPEEPRYICPKGSQIKNKIWYKGSFTKDLIITEGELCAMAVNEVGLSSIGIPGLSQAIDPNLHKRLRKIIEDNSIQRVFIIFDTDPGIKDDVGKLSVSLALRLGLADASILYLPQDDPTEKMDLDLFLSRYDVSNLMELLEDSWHNRKALILGLKRRIRNLNDRKNEGSCQGNSP